MDVLVAAGAPDRPGNIGGALKRWLEVALPLNPQNIFKFVKNLVAAIGNRNRVYRQRSRFKKSA